MAVIRWAGFAGENRALHPKLLGDAVGTVSRNAKPGRGDLRPWREPEPVRSQLMASTGSDVVLTNYTPPAMVLNETAICF